jgi:Na+-driven multidrug efflux pump
MPDIDPVTQAKALKRLAVIMVFAGLTIGIGLPALFIAFAIEPALTLWGVDAVWLLALATMIFDFVMAWNFWRRAMVLEQRR